MDLRDTRPAAFEAGESLGQVVLGPVPARYTTGVHEKICDHIRAGNRPITAAQMAGIPSNTFYQWMKMGREGNPHLVKFVEDVEIAGGEAEGKAVKVVTDSMFEKVESAQWYLERTRPAGFSKEVNARVDAILIEIRDRLRDAFDDVEYARIMTVISGGTLESSLPVKFQLRPKVEDAVILEG